MGHNAFAQVTNKDVVAKIKTEEISELIKITSTVTNNTDVIKSLRYVAYVFKENPQSKNVSRNEQSGRFVLQGNEQKILCTTNINRKIKDKVTAVLLIYDSDDDIVKVAYDIVANSKPCFLQTFDNPLSTMFPRFSPIKACSKSKQCMNCNNKVNYYLISIETVD